MSMMIANQPTWSGNDDVGLLCKRDSLSNHVNASHDTCGTERDGCPERFEHFIDLKGQFSGRSQHDREEALRSCQKGLYDWNRESSGLP